MRRLDEQPAPAAPTKPAPTKPAPAPGPAAPIPRRKPGPNPFRPPKPTEDPLPKAGYEDEEELEECLGEAFMVSEDCDILLDGEQYRLQKGDKIMVESFNLDYLVQCSISRSRSW